MAGLARSYGVSGCTRNKETHTPTHRVRFRGKEKKKERKKERKKY